ncbi:ATP-binding SpoIIE family protein phosphatase [Kitasatospora terrestris]|uniref:Phosphatase n=1 Tax=Kitasatospora terrestris TaxID=258051 RepID=A0ABP9D9X4_9ACTN
MEIDVDAVLREVALRLQPRTRRLAARLVVRVREAVPTVWAHEDLAELATLSVQQHLDNVLGVIEHGRDAAAAEAPPAAIDFATRLAEYGGDISELLRSYRLGHVAALGLFRDEVARSSADPQLPGAVAGALIELSFAYVDRTSGQAVAAYQDARDRRLQRRLMVVNEAGRRIGTSLDITRTAQELAEVGVENLADFVVVDLLDAVLGAEDPPLDHDALTLRRIAQYSVLDGYPEAVVPTGHTHTYPPGSGPAEAVRTGHPSRYRIAADGIPLWAAHSEPHRHSVEAFGIHEALMTPLWARGVPLGIAQFFRHRDATPFDDDDLLLAQEIASRAAVHIDNARRYTHQRTTALALQQNLLPSLVTRHGAVDTAVRYLPSGARSGVAGDWYDVIPLSGARIALVVGDVVGRGLYASATMGRLRTAVRTLADVDLMPDELLTHLDDVVIRMQHEEGRLPDETSATCLYAVYDPVARVCSLASAGHVLPAVVEGGGAGQARFVEARVGPPLGLGGLPFETTQCELPAGSLLALFTDGLVQGAARNPVGGLADLRRLLGRPGPSLEAVCDRIVAGLLPGRPADDAVLLLARTRALDADHVTTLDLSADPSSVSLARTFATDRLAAWGLDDLAFSTELIVSELVTNVIRYGRQPATLRLILQSTLICEVADAANTSPHLRRARVYDEGGRGLFLVAQLSKNWGTRHTRDGKVIWAEQSLPES